jgi:uncharacterized membrane protein
VLVGLACLAAAVFLSGVVVVPWLETVGAGGLPRLAYRPLCHQIPGRCLDLGAGPLAVCARCSGLYLGGLLGLVAALMTGALRGRRAPCPSWRVLAITALPSLVDVAAGQLGLGELSPWPRFVVATAPGVVLGLLLAYAVEDLADRSTARRARTAPPAGPSSPGQGCVQSTENRSAAGNKNGL